MAIKRDLSHLPTPTAAKTDGVAPDASPRFGHILAEAWAAHHEANPLPRAHPDALFRHSDAGGCARALGYAAIDLPPSNPMDLAGYWVVQLGHMIHDAWQVELPKRFPGAEVEVKVHEGRRAGHVDAVVKLPPPPLTNQGRQSVIAIEGKSVGGFKYQLAVGARGQAEGPSESHVIQGAMNGLLLDADEVVIVYWSRDAISVQQAERKSFDELRRFTAEWTFTREQYEPIARREIERVDAILGMVDDGMLPARKIPGLPARAVIIQPSKGAWVNYDERGQATDSGTAWQCAYCRWQDTCSRTAAGRTPVETVVDPATIEG